MNNAITKAKPHPNEKTAQILWTGFILMFFVIQAVIWTVAFTLTSGDKSHAVLPDYDSQALKWDEVKKARQDSALLGWTAAIKPADEADIYGSRQVTVELIDKSGAAVAGSEVQIRAYHRGTAAVVQDVKFAETSPGVYQSNLIIRKFGLWCFEGSAVKDGKTFLIDETIRVKKSAGE